jgi:N-acetylmuramoyl-L-alanine amidase
MIQDNFSGKLKRNDRKVKQAGFIVLHQTFMPSVLVETGFLTNKNEGAYLNSNKGQLEMGTAIANAILKYKGATKANTSPVVVSKKFDAADVQKKTTAEAIVKEKLASEKVLAENKVVEKAKEPIGLSQEEIEVDDTAIVAVPQSRDIITKAINNEGIKVTNEKPVAEIKETERTATNVVFKVQLMASGKDLASDSDYFKGLNRISKEPYNKLYRYLYGETRSHREAEMMKSKAASSGFSTAYIVAYRDGVRIAIEEALKEVSQ